MGKIMAKILGQDAVEFGRNNPCRLDLGHDLDQDHGQDFFRWDEIHLFRTSTAYKVLFAQGDDQLRDISTSALGKTAEIRTQNRNFLSVTEIFCPLVKKRTWK